MLGGIGHYYSDGLGFAIAPVPVTGTGPRGAEVIAAWTARAAQQDVPEAAAAAPGDSTVVVVGDSWKKEYTYALVAGGVGLLLLSVVLGKVLR